MGCGSDSEGGEFVAPDKVGYFIDSPVANLDYERGDKKAKTNKTNSDGFTNEKYIKNYNSITVDYVAGMRRFI